MFRDRYEIDLSRATPKEISDINFYINLSDHFEKGIKDFGKITMGAGTLGIAIGCSYVITKSNPIVCREVMRTCCNLSILNASLTMLDYSLEKTFNKLIFKTANDSGRIKIKEK